MNPSTANPYSGFQDFSQGPSQTAPVNPLFASSIGNKTPVSNPSNTPKQSGNFWSTVGGIALPVLGALLAPETGGASLLASTALSGAGGLFGKAVDNSVAGQDPFQANNIEQGVLNAGGNLAGGALAKGIGSFAGKVVKPVADKTATSLLEGQGKGALDNATADYLYKNGVTDLRQVGDIAPLVTQGEGAFTNAVNNSLLNAADNGTRINLSSLAKTSDKIPGDTVLNAVRDAGIAGDNNSVKSIQDLVQGQLEKYNQGALKSVPIKGGGSMTNFDNGVLASQQPLDALQMSKDLDRTANDWLKSSSPNIQAQGRALRNISNTIKENLYGEGTTIGNMGVSDQVRQTALAELEPLKAINPQYYNTKVNELNSAKTLGDLRTAQSPDVKASIALDTANHLANTSGGTDVSNLFKIGAPIAGMSIGGPAGLAAGLIAPKVLGSETASVGGTKALAGLSKAIGSKKANDVMTTLGRIAGVGAVNIPGAGAAPTQPTTLSNIPTGSPQEGTTVNTQQPDQLNTLLQAMQAQAILAPELNPQATSLLSSFAPTLQKNQLLKNSVNALSSEYANAGGAQGLGGIGSVLSGFVPGTSANAYNGEVNSLSAQLAKALGISPEEAQNLLPSLLQNEQTAGQRQNVLSGLVSGLPS